MVPELVGKLTDLGYEVLVEPEAGARAEYADELYAEAGAIVTDDALAEADVVLGVNALSSDRARRLRDGRGRRCPSCRSTPPTTSSRTCATSAITSFAMELVPRISRAQSMDALSSQALVVRLPLRDRGRRAAAPLLPAEHDGGRHGAARAGRRARCRCRRAAGDRDGQAARRGRAGVRRPRRRRRGDPLHGREVDRPRARDARGIRWLRPRDDRGPGRPADARCSRRTSPTRTR